MYRRISLLSSHLAVFLAGGLTGIYLLPILIAPAKPAAASLAESASKAVYSGHFNRSLPGSDFLHWGEGEVHVLPDRIAHIGRLAPGPDYKLYLAPRFVSTKAEFESIKARSRLIGDVKTFDGFLVPVPAGVDPGQYRSVVIWCESFSQFITAAEYRPALDPPTRTSS